MDAYSCLWFLRSHSSPFKPRWSLPRQVSLSPHLPLSQFTSLGLGIVLETQLLPYQFLSLTSGLHLPHFSGILLFLGHNPKSLMWHWTLHTVWPSPPQHETHFTHPLPSSHTGLGVLHGCQQLSTHRAFAHAAPVPKCCPSSPNSPDNSHSSYSQLCLFGLQGTLCGTLTQP